MNNEQSERTQSNSEDLRSFKERYPFGKSFRSLNESTLETRQKWAVKAIEQYPNKLPLIIERATT